MDFSPELPPEVWHKILFDYDLSPADVAAVRLVAKGVVWPLDLAKWHALAGPEWCMATDRPRALVLSLEREQLSGRWTGPIEDALRWGCARGYLAVVQYCLSRGCPIRDFYNTFRMGARGGHAEVVRLLGESCPSNYTFTVLVGYCEGGHLDLLKAFGLGGIHLSQVTRLISRASFFGHSEVVRYLVAEAAARPETDMDRLLLTMSVYGILAAVDALISKGADPSAFRGRSVFRASAAGHSEVADRLLEDPRLAWAKPGS